MFTLTLLYVKLTAEVKNCIRKTTPSYYVSAVGDFTQTLNCDLYIDASITEFF